MAKDKHFLKTPLTARAWLFFEDYKRLFQIAMCILIVIAIIYVVSRAWAPLQDPLISGLLGILLGAIGGGAFSIYVSRRELEATAAISKKNDIYIPIYNDLMIIKEIPEEEHYLKEIMMRGENFLRVFAWQQIKSDNRYIEVPQYIANILDELVVKYVSYTQVYNEVNDSITSRINEILIAEYNVANINQDMGHCVLAWGMFKKPDSEAIRRCIFTALVGKDEYDALQKLSEKERQLQQNTLNTIRLNEKQIEDIEPVIYGEIAKLGVEKRLGSSYKEFKDYLDEVLSLLAHIITVITKKYEIRRGLF